GLSFDWTGLAAWGDKWVRGVNVLGSEGDGLDRIDVYNPDGTLDKSIPTQINPRAGVTVIGDAAYTIGPAHDENAYWDNYIHGYDMNTGNRVMWSEYVHFYAKGKKKIAIGSDGSNLLVAGIGGSPATLYVFKYNPSTG